MSDRDLRELERAHRERPEDAWARYRYAKAMQRLGRLDEVRPLVVWDTVDCKLGIIGGVPSRHNEAAKALPIVWPFVWPLPSPESVVLLEPADPDWGPGARA